MPSGIVACGFRPSVNVLVRLLSINAEGFTHLEFQWTNCRYPGQVDLFRLARHQIYGFAVYRTFETESSAPFLKLRDRGIPESGIPYCATSK
jgi:hypothetical protein